MIKKTAAGKRGKGTLYIEGKEGREEREKGKGEWVMELEKRWEERGERKEKRDRGNI